MKITLKVSEVTSFQTHLLVIPMLEQKKKDPVVAAIDKAVEGNLRKLMELQGFKAQKGHSLSMTGGQSLAAKRVLLMGVALDESASAPFVIRSLGAKISAAALGLGSGNMAVVLPTVHGEAAEDIVHWMAEGLVLGQYRYSLKSAENERKRKLKSCTLLLASNGKRKAPVITGGIRKTLSQAKEISSSVMLARDLVNAPSNRMTPDAFATEARKVARRRGIKITVLGKKMIEQKGMGMLAAVSSGSGKSPRFVHMKYSPASCKATGRICLVGKGITFDSGGLSLKPPASQPDMKSDMAGAATVLGVMDAAASSGVKWEIHGILPLCENMPDGGAYRPGDILESKLGKTVEITNTDAEGRLILADALAYAGDLKPDMIIDLATLTGACVVALGPITAGLFSDDEELASALLKASKRAGEDFWRLPMTKALRKQLDTPVADMKNTGTRWGGAITAALFLKEFAGKHRWAHLDIAGPAFLSEKYGFSPKGASGFGVLTLLEFLRMQ